MLLLATYLVEGPPGILWVSSRLRVAIGSATVSSNSRDRSMIDGLLFMRNIVVRLEIRKDFGEGEGKEVEKKMQNVG